MENNLYIPFGANHSSDDNIIALIERYGMAGYGIYVALLFELRVREHYQCALRTLPVLARRWDVSLEMLTDIVSHFQLFALRATEKADLNPTETTPQPEYFHSPYLDTVMQPLNQKRIQNTLNGKHRVATATRADNGTFTSVNQPIKENKEKKEEEVEEKKENEKPSSPSWERHVDQAFAERSWVEVQAIHSGMKKTFVDRLPEIIDFFKNHIRTYGKEGGLLSDADAKSYFSNFIRPQSPTQLALLAHLGKRKDGKRAADPYRYEQRDPLTGARSYCGQTIPQEAPPRPDENAVWSDELHEWA